MPGAAGSLATATELDQPGRGCRRPEPSATGSAAGSSARAAAGWPRSGSGRSSPSAGRRASGSSSAGSSRSPRRPTTALQGALLLVAYTLGLGLPFLLIAAVYDRAPRLLAPLVRHGRVVSLVGGLLVAFIGVAMVFDWLSLLPALLQLQHGDLSGASDPGSPTGPSATGSSARSAAGSCWPRSGRSSSRSSSSSRSRRRSATPATGPGTVDPRPTQFIIGPRRRRGCNRATSRPSSTVAARRRFDLPADRPRRAPDPPRRPARQGRLGQLLGELVPAVPAGDADPPRAGRALPRRRPRRRRDRRPGDRAGRHPRLRRRVRADYTIGFDASGHIFRRYKVFGLPTQFFIRPDGVIASVGKTVDEASAVAAIEAILP